MSEERVGIRRKEWQFEERVTIQERVKIRRMAIRRHGSNPRKGQKPEGGLKLRYVKIDITLESRIKHFLDSNLRSISIANLFYIVLIAPRNPIFFAQRSVKFIINFKNSPP